MALRTGQHLPELVQRSEDTFKSDRAALITSAGSVAGFLGGSALYEPLYGKRLMKTVMGGDLAHKKLMAANAGIQERALTRIPKGIQDYLGLVEQVPYAVFAEGEAQFRDGTVGRPIMRMGSVPEVRALGVDGVDDLLKLTRETLELKKSIPKLEETALSLRDKAQRMARFAPVYRFGAPVALGVGTGFLANRLQKRLGRRDEY